MSPAFFDGAAVERLLDYPGCVAAMRSAMTALSADDAAQPLRQILQVRPKAMFGLMPGSLSTTGVFGAKLVSVFPEVGHSGRARHQGVVVAFDAETGAVACIADAESVTRIRTGSATAAATDALARPDAEVLAVFGLGAQAEAHLRALTLVRPFSSILLWGRDAAKTGARAAELAAALSLPITPVSDARAAASQADVICTVSGAPEPIVLGAWLKSGVHVNLVGSSYLGPVEVDSALVAAGRYFADYRPSVLAQASELAVAREAGLVTDDHVVGEIGAVFAGRLDGRQSPDQITIYKSLGHVAQDLAAAAYLLQRSPA
ncbi:ornithine cyclodeaminase family protein [Caulobacter sp. RHG1]|uniref:ornithine cyclodeaminase family protein n=1 Tax=Caulobacter sp. (strain RHG1) TaxID=2545762 RepID=UPI001552FF98|nr:Ornithine cyclodeaminase [Caulobacter sp. RHG1]